MIDDDDLFIEESHDAVHEEGEEEDLLADVAQPSLSGWNWGDPESEHLPAPAPTLIPGGRNAARPGALPQPGFTPTSDSGDAVISLDVGGFLGAPPLTVAAPPPRLRDVELEELLDSPEPEAPSVRLLESSAVAADAGRGVPILVADPQSSEGESPAATVLARMGFATSLVETAAAARDELNRGSFPVVFLRVTGDAGWARMLVLTGQERWPDVKFMASVPRGGVGVMQQLMECGCADVVEEPLPSDTALLFRLQALIPDLLPSQAHNQAMMDEMQELRARLTQMVVESEAKAKQMAARAQDAEHRLQGVTAENTRRGRELNTVKHELATLKDRASSLEGALAKATADAARKPAGSNPPSAAGDVNTHELKTLLAALHPYAFAMDQALDFLAAAAKQPGADPELARHVKNLQLVKVVLKRLQAKVG